MADQNTPPTASLVATRANHHTKLRPSLPTLPPTQAAGSSEHEVCMEMFESDSDNGSHAGEAEETGSTAGPDYTSAASSCAGDGQYDDNECDLVPLFDDVEEIVATASALAGPGDYYDLDQLPLLDPLDPALDAANGSAPKKRKRPTSIIEISDSEHESLAVPEEFSDGTDQDEPTPKRRNPTQISSYTPNTRTVLRLGKHMFREKVLVSNAFPSRRTQASLGRESWEASRISLPVATAGKLFTSHGFNPLTLRPASGTTLFDKHILQVLTTVICATRASVKGQACELVMDQYTLKNPANIAFNTTPKSARIFNQAQVELLQKDYKFIYGTFGTYPDGTVRNDVPFAHPSLSLLIYRAVYMQTSPLERSQYDPMPLPLVALAATAMYAALDDWCTGRYLKRSFTTSGYSSHYEHLLTGLKQFQTVRPHRCAALMASYTAYCKDSDTEVPDARVSELRVCNTDTEDDSD